MTTGARRPWEAVNFEELVRSFPPAPDYFETLFFADPEQLDRLQLQRAKERARQAESIPFFARLWEKAGVSAKDLRNLDDLWKFPTYDVDDIRESIERNPPWGDYQGVSPNSAEREPLRCYMSGGTTGKSRPTLYTQWDREVCSNFAARHLYRAGIRPGDVVLNSFQYSTFNGGALFDEALHHWLNCVVISTSSGNVTPTAKQVQLAAEYGATAILTTGDHLLRIALVAEELGLDPKVDLNINAVGGLGDLKPADETRALLDRFGVDEYYESYGFHEVGMAAIECPEHDGLHVFDEAMIIQIVDVDSGMPLPDGELGSMVVTEFFKTGSAQFRYNTLDLSWLYPREQCRCGSWMRRIGKFSGRADNMVKLRGVNVWPEALGGVAIGVPGCEGDYFVRARREGDRDDILVSVVSREDPSRFEGLQAEIEGRLHQHFGLKISAEVVAPGTLDELTEIGKSPKPKRFRDDRGGQH
jgi:phenylacetate-CoA ligase